jgi:tetratricopeptide (TPR) repeat protein
MAAMLDSIEKILGNILTQPTTKTETDLQALAQSAPTNPMPVLALAIVTGFSQPERFSEVQTTLKKAQGLVTAATDAEMTFSRALAGVASSQFAIMEAQKAPNPIGKLSDAEIRAIQATQKQASAAIAALKAAAAQNKASALAQAVTAMLLTFSRDTSTGKADYTAGVAQLTQYKSQGASQDLAGFFLIYAYRRAGQYPQAISTGQALEQRHPSSSLVKKVIGSCYYFSNDLVNAESFYRQALVLDAKDPSIQLGLAEISAKKGDMAAAKQFATSATQLDTAGRLTPYIKAIEQTMTLQTPVP